MNNSRALESHQSEVSSLTHSHSLSSFIVMAFVSITWGVVLPVVRRQQDDGCCTEEQKYESKCGMTSEGSRQGSQCEHKLLAPTQSRRQLGRQRKG